MPYLRGTKYPVLKREELSDLERETWVLRDEFLTALAAGAVNGTACTPGPGTRTVVDTENKLSIADGKLTFAGGKASLKWGDPGCWFPAVTRVAGRMLIAKLNETSGEVGFGLSKNNSGMPSDNAGVTYGLVNSSIQGYSITGLPYILGGISTTTDYYCLVVLRLTGGFHFIKGGIYTNWVLIFVQSNDNTATLYPCVVSYSAPSTSDFLRIPTILWLPSPLLSDTFTAYPVSNGLGHAEGVAGGIGSGGSGKTWLDAGSWAVAGGYLVNTPVLGAELVTNGGFDTDTTGWTPYNTSLASIAGGQSGNCLEMTKGGAVGAANARQIPTSIIAKWYKVQGYSKSGTSGDNLVTIGIVNNAESAWLAQITATSSGAWTLLLGTYRASETNSKLRLEKSDGTSGTLLFDTISYKQLYLSSLFTLSLQPTTDVLAEMVLHSRTLGTQVGFVQSDRPFSCTTTGHSAGSNDIALTGLTTFPVTTNETLVIGGTAYTVSAVGALSNGNQTVTLGSDPGVVAAGTKVGIEWASWNGSLHYSDGAGYINADEVVAGVYTNRSHVAFTYVADKRFIMRKIGSEYRLFYAEALNATVTSIAAAAQVGKYFGFFSTDANNQITSTVIYDTGNKTGCYGLLDKF